MTSQIENFFVEVENLIELQLRDKVQNQLEVKQKFKDGKRLIDDLEEDDMKQFRLFRYKYHTGYRTPKYICRGRVHYCVAVIEKFYEARFGFAYKVRIF